MPAMSITERDAALYLRTRLGKDRNLLDAELDMALRCSRNPILDLCCGPGIFLVPLASGHDVRGVDCSPEMLRLAQERAEEQGISIAVQEGDALQFRSSERFGLVLLQDDTLGTLFPTEAAGLIRRAHDALAEDGTLLLSAPRTECPEVPEAMAASWMDCRKPAIQRRRQGIFASRFL